MRIVSALCCCVLTGCAAAVEYHAIAHPQNVERFGCSMPNEDYRMLGSTAPYGVYYAGEAVALRLRLKRGAEDAGLVAGFALDFQEITQREGEGADPALAGMADFGPPEMMRPQGEPVRYAFPVTFPPDTAVALVELKDVPLPARFGTYAVILVRTAAAGKVVQRQLLGTLARVPRDNPDATVRNTWILGEGNFIAGANAEQMEVGAGFYERLGIRGMRCEISWRETPTAEEQQSRKYDPQAVGTYDWSHYDPMFAVSAKHRIAIMATLDGQAGWQWPFQVEPTPAARWHLTSGGYGGSGDWVCGSELYPRYQKWITAFCQRYWQDGKGALWGVEHYNEPWEGGGISGWARDMLQYRQMMKMIAAATRSVSKDIVLFAASSIMNTEDKFYSDGTREMDAVVDVYSDHYVKPPVCYGPMVAAAHGKESMETESWIANAEYRLPLAVLTFLASGQTRINPWHPRDLYDTMPGGTPAPTPLAVATATMNAMTSGKPFEKVVFREHLPWLFQFGKDGDASGLVVMCGQLLSFGVRTPQDNVRERPWAQVEGSNGGTIAIDNADGLLQFFDLAGNRVHEGEKTVTLPLSFLPTYLRSAKGPAAIAERIRAAPITGKRPVEILPQDFSARPGKDLAELVVKVHNCLNQPISGTLSARTPSGITLQATSQKLNIEAGATVAVRFAVTASQADPANSYPCAFTFDSAAGKVEYAEVLNAAVAVRAKIAIDGDLADWDAIPGITVVAGSEKFDATEAARRPWLAIAEQQPDGTFAQVKLAWDDDNLYICARVNDATPDLTRERLGTRNDDDVFHSAKSDGESPYKEFLDTRKLGDKTLRELGYSFAQVPYVYKAGWDHAFFGERLQFAIDATEGWHDLKANTDRVPLGFTAVPDTDYEYSSYLCKDGAGELWRLLAPGVSRVHDYARQPKPKDGLHTGPVTAGKHVVRVDGKVRIHEIALPRSELKTLVLAKGTSFGFTFQVGNSQGPTLASGEGKAVVKLNGLTMHPYWMPSNSCGVRWTLVEP